MPVHPLESYLAACAATRATGAATDETAYYPVLKALLDAAGQPLKADVLAIEKAEQVTGYWERNNQVLVTNYREFLLVGRDDRGRPVRHEHYRLADSDKAFWRLAARPKEAAREHGDRLLDFLRRCLRRPAPLTE